MTVGFQQDDDFIGMGLKILGMPPVGYANSPLRVGVTKRRFSTLCGGHSHPNTMAGLLYANTCSKGVKVALPNCLLFYLVIKDNVHDENDDKDLEMDEDHNLLWLPWHP
jgi:hypothetical protein